MIDICNKYNISILFSTKSDTTYGANLNPDLHTFQLSVTNVDSNKLLEPAVPDIEKRYEFYRQLKDNGFKVGVRIQPFVPNVTYPNLDVVVRVSISASTYDHPYGEYDMQYIDYIGCTSTRDGNVVIVLE